MGGGANHLRERERSGVNRLFIGGNVLFIGFFIRRGSPPLYNRRSCFCTALGWRRANASAAPAPSPRLALEEEKGNEEKRRRREMKSGEGK